jgi:hypothetical protein
MNESVFINRLTRYLREVRDETRSWMAAPTRTWKGKPDFRTYLIVTKSGVNLKVLAVGKNAKKYNWLDKGTRAHRITARNHPTLYFQEDYSPATIPNSLESFNALKSGSFVDPVSVRHPGVKARGFTKQVMNKMKPKFRKACERAIKDGISAAK